VIAAFDLKSDSPVVITSDDDVLVRDAVRGSAAAPTYLQPHQTNGWELIDGGVWANNPILLALPDIFEHGGEAIVVSVGTGHAPPKPTRREDWAAQTARLIGQTTETEISAFLFARAANPDQYFRFQFALPEKVRMDDPSPSNLDGLTAIANRSITEWSSRLDQLVDHLRSR